MADQVSMEDYLNSLLSDVNVKLRDIEEKQNIIKDRVILIGENLVSEKDSSDAEILGIKGSIKSLESEIRGIKLAIQRIIGEHENFARKTELEVLKRQFQMFQPLEFARMSDVESIVKNVLKEERKKQ